MMKKYISILLIISVSLLEYGCTSIQIEKPNKLDRNSHIYEAVKKGGERITFIYPYGMILEEESAIFGNINDSTQVKVKLEDVIYVKVSKLDQDQAPILFIVFAVILIVVFVSIEIYNTNKPLRDLKNYKPSMQSLSEERTYLINETQGWAKSQPFQKLRLSPFQWIQIEGKDSNRRINSRMDTNEVIYK